MKTTKRTRNHLARLSGEVSALLVKLASVNQALALSLAGDDDPATATNGRLLTTTEAMAVLKVSRSSLDRMVKSGRLPVVRIGERQPRFRPTDLDAITGAPGEGEA